MKPVHLATPFPPESLLPCLLHLRADMRMLLFLCATVPFGSLVSEALADQNILPKKQRADHIRVVRNDLYVAEQLSAMSRLDREIRVGMCAEEAANYNRAKNGPQNDARPAKVQEAWAKEKTARAEFSRCFQQAMVSSPSYSALNHKPNSRDELLGNYEFIRDNWFGRGSGASLKNRLEDLKKEQQCTGKIEDDAFVFEEEPRQINPYTTAKRTVVEFYTDAVASKYSKAQRWYSQGGTAIACTLSVLPIAALSLAPPVSVAASSLAGLTCAALNIDTLDGLRAGDRLIYRETETRSGNYGGLEKESYSLIAIGHRDAGKKLVWVIAALDENRIKAAVNQELHLYPSQLYGADNSCANAPHPSMLPAPRHLTPRMRTLLPRLMYR